MRLNSKNILIIFVILIFNSLAVAQTISPRYANYNVPLNFSMFDFAGDSRTTLINVGGNPGQATNAQSWFNNANALAGQRYILNIQNGGSGCRTDQFLAPAVIAPMLASQAGWFVINFPAVNDLAAQTGNVLQVSNSCANSGGTFPYTNNNGISVTQTTVGAVAAGNIITAAQQALAVGKKVILISEVGATNTTTASIGQLYDLNARLLAFANQNPGKVYYVDFTHSMWNPTSSATALAFIGGTACLSDGVHPTALCGFIAGQAFNTAMESLFPVLNQQLANISSVSTNPRQLVANPLFTTLTGGTTAGCSTITGNIPSGWALNCGLNTTTITVTSAASTWCVGVGVGTGTCGNDVTLAITCAGAGVINFQPTAPSTANWNLTDIFQFSINASVASGSSNAAVYANVSVNTSGGGNNFYSNYAGVGAIYGPGPTTAYSITLNTPTNQGAGSVSTLGTKNFILGQAIVYCSAAGNITVTYNQPALNRVYNYSNGVFSGQ